MERKQSQPDLTVCDIMGDWGPYQWSVTLFAILYSSIIGITVVVGPMWTPEIKHVCNSNLHMINKANVDFSLKENWHQCFTQDNNNNDQQATTIMDEIDKSATFSKINNHNSSSTKTPNQSKQQFVECSSFIYDDENYGKLLTNTFDLVCSRKWLRSFLSSSALIGMLLSSVTLGVLSDKFGRIRCIQVAFLIAIPSTIGAIFAHNYLLLNICFLLMSYAQVGAANALSTLVMEATSPKYRFVPVFEYSFGWALGMSLVPIINSLTKNYQHFLLVTLIWQLLMLLWFRWGVFESIRWLLSEGQINRAQIELQRACRINKVKNGAQLAHKIAQVQMAQLRKASMLIDDTMAPERLARATQKQVGDAKQELNILGAAIRRSFAIESPPEDSYPKNIGSISTNTNTYNEQQQQQQQQQDNNIVGGKIENNNNHQPTLPSVLSPTLSRRSFSVQSAGVSPPPLFNPNPKPERNSVELLALGQNYLGQQQRNSITTQGLIQLTLKYSKALQEQDEGRFFVIRMFHRKLYKITIMLMLLSIVLETTYYGLVQANKFVGSNVNLNYLVGSMGEMLATCIYMIVLWLFSRRVALIVPTLISALACFCIALNYHLIPDQPIGNTFSFSSLSLSSQAVSNGMFEEQQQQQQQFTTTTMSSLIEATNITNVLMDQVDSLILSDTIPALIGNESTATTTTESMASALINGSSLNLSDSLLLPNFDDDDATLQSITNKINLRETINFWLMTVGKLSVNVAMQTGATIGMEAYPNNLRQTGSSAILFIGRVCSILAPFLFNDHSEQKTTFKVTLVSLSLIGLIVCLMVPHLLRDTKNKELCDRLNDIKEDDDT